MPLELWTAQYAIPDRDRLDITRGGADRARAAGKPAPPGAFLAPSAGLVFPYLAALKAIGAAEGALPVPRWAEEARGALWKRYKATYLVEQRAVYRRDRAPFDALLARKRIVFACFCAGEDVVLRKHCHRFIAAEDMFVKLGAVYRGELRAEDALAPPASAEKPPAILFGPERPCQTFMFTDGSGAGGIICRSRGSLKRCATCGQPGPLLCDAPVTRKNGKAGTCNARICERCAHTIGDDQHHCPAHAAQEARSA